MSGGRDLRELIGDDVPADELERLRHAHELLVAAGPPPELPPSLAEPPAVARSNRPRERSFLPRRRLGAALVLAAALLAAAFGGGYLLGGTRADFERDFALDMSGTAAAPAAFASLEVGVRDEAGNWPLLMHVRGLERLPRDGYYELFLTRGGRPVLSCGTFRIEGGSTTVRLNAPYRLKRFDGWIVSASLPGRPSSENRVLLTT